MLEEKNPEPSPEFRELAKQFAQGVIPPEQFLAQIEQAVKKRERKAFYFGIVAFGLLILVVAVFEKIFPGIIAWKY